MKNRENLGKADLHIHSTHSYDGVSTPEEIVHQASKVGMDVIAICDHDEVSGAIEAQKYEKKYGVDVIVGEEVLTNEGEVIGLFLKKKIKEGMSLKETVKEIKKQSGLVVIPHPFALFPVTRPAVSIKKLYTLLKEHNINPDALEVLNSMPVGRGMTKKTKRINDKVFSVAEVAGSDAHIKNHIGMSITLFPGKDKKSLKKAILEKQTSVYGEFISRRESTKFVTKNVAKVGKKAKDRISKPYNKIKEKFNNHLL